MVAASACGAVPAAASAWTSGYSEIVDLNTNGASCLDVANGSTANGANVQQWGCWGGPQQEWELVSTSTAGFYEVVNENSGKCLDVANGSNGNGTNVQQWGCWGGPGQLWHPEPSNGSYYSLWNYISIEDPNTSNGNSGLCLDVAGSSTTNGTNVQQWGCWNTSGQQWNGSNLSAAYSNATTSCCTEIFDEEFNGAAGTQPGSPWTIVTGSQFWTGQCEVNDTGHVSEGGGVLSLTATYSPGACGGSSSYETGAIQVPFSTWNYQYGTAFARVQVPCQSGTGVWPGWWQFDSQYGNGTNYYGEIDTLEVMDTQSPPGENAESSIHGGSGNLIATGAYRNPIGQNWCNNYHVFGNVWRPGEIDFTVDGVMWLRLYASSYSTWPFDTYAEAPVLSLLVGGYGGSPNSSTFPQTMRVDWVRIWRS